MNYQNQCTIDDNAIKFKGATNSFKENYNLAPQLTNSSNAYISQKFTRYISVPKCVFF